MINLTPLLEAVIALLVTAITAYIIPYIKSKTSNDKLKRMKELALLGVKAAEQIYKGSAKGKLKKEYVLNFLSSHGYVVDFNELETLIEASVTDIKNENCNIINQEVLECE